MKYFAKLVNGFQLLTTFAKGFILDVWQGSQYASEYRVNLFLPNFSYWSPWKHRKTKDFLMISGGSKGNIRKKRVKMSQRAIENIRRSIISWGRSLSYRNQSFDLQILYETDILYEKVETVNPRLSRAFYKCCERWKLIIAIISDKGPNEQFARFKDSLWVWWVEQTFLSGNFHNWKKATTYGRINNIWVLHHKGYKYFLLLCFEHIHPKGNK